MTKKLKSKDMWLRFEELLSENGVGMAGDFFEEKIVIGVYPAEMRRFVEKEIQIVRNEERTTKKAKATLNK